MGEGNGKMKSDTLKRKLLRMNSYFGSCRDRFSLVNSYRMGTYLTYRNDLVPVGRGGLQKGCELGIFIFEM